MGSRGPCGALGLPVPEITFCGEQFTTSERIGLMPLMRYAQAEKTGDYMGGLVALYDLLEQCIDPAEWGRFQLVAERERADEDTLTDVVRDVIEALAARPTGRSSDSSDGPVTGSSPDAASRLVTDFESKGRPDLALLVQQAASA